MVTKVNSEEKQTLHYNTGDLLEVTRKDGSTFSCIVLEDFGGGFVSRVLRKDEGIGIASWKRFGLRGNSRFQLAAECESIKKIAEATKSTAKSSLSLNESVQKSNLTYYETQVGEDRYITFCESEGFGGWAEYSKNRRGNALKESYLNSQIAKVRHNNSTSHESV